MFFKNCDIFDISVKLNDSMLYCYVCSDFEEKEFIKMEGDIGGGLVMERQITIPKENCKIVKIESAIVARKVGAGSGGFSR